MTPEEVKAANEHTWYFRRYRKMNHIGRNNKENKKDKKDKKEEGANDEK